MLVATLVTKDVVFWHLLGSAAQNHRISYTDPRLDELDIKIPDAYALRALEGSRHIIGWCAKTRELCGK
jgi:hypothetical protein